MSRPWPGNDADGPESPDREASGRLRRPGPRLLAALALLTALAAVAAWWAGSPSRHGTDLVAEATAGATGLADLPRAGDRAVVLEFPRWNGDGWISENRRISSRGEPGEDLLALMGELCAGPGTGRAISPLPRGTRALAAFLDPARGTAVLDFSRELVTRHPGGSAAETATLVSIMRTVAANYPQVEACTILVDGRPIGTLAGHLDLARPFAPRRWR